MTPTRRGGHAQVDVCGRGEGRPHRKLEPTDVTLSNGCLLLMQRS